MLWRLHDAVCFSAVVLVLAAHMLRIAASLSFCATPSSTRDTPIRRSFPPSSPFFLQQPLPRATSEDVALADTSETIGGSGDWDVEEEESVVRSKPAAVMATSRTQGLSISPLKTWILRLNTYEDMFSVHKISAATQLLTAIAISAVGASTNFQEMPDGIPILAYTFVLSTVTLAIAGSRMAWLYRGKELTIRNGMILVAFSAASFAIVLIWAAPFCPPFLATDQASNVLWNGFGVALAALGFDGVKGGAETIENRRLKKREMGGATPVSSDGVEADGVLENADWLDWVGYVGPNLIPLFVACVVLWKGQIDPLTHDRFLEKCADGIFDPLQAFYVSVPCVVATSYVPFFQTLRDKALIPKNAEYLGILIASIIILPFVVPIVDM